MHLTFMCFNILPACLPATSLTSYSSLPHCMQSSLLFTLTSFPCCPGCRTECAPRHPGSGASGPGGGHQQAGSHKQPGQGGSATGTIQGMIYFAAFRGWFLSQGGGIGECGIMKTRSARYYCWRVEKTEWASRGVNSTACYRAGGVCVCGCSMGHCVGITSQA